MERTTVAKCAKSVETSLSLKRTCRTGVCDRRIVVGCRSIGRRIQRTRPACLMFVVVGISWAIKDWASALMPGSARLYARRLRDPAELNRRLQKLEISANYSYDRGWYKSWKHIKSLQREGCDNARALQCYIGERVHSPLSSLPTLEPSSPSQVPRRYRCRRYHNLDLARQALP